MQLQDKTPKQLADMIATRINIGGVLVVVNPHPAYGWHPTVMTAPAHAIKCQQIAEQVESRKLAAVKSEGLQPQQYNQVIQLVQADAHLRQKFLSYADRVKSGAE